MITAGVSILSLGTFTGSYEQHGRVYEWGYGLMNTGINLYVRLHSYILLRTVICVDQVY